MTAGIALRKKDGALHPADEDADAWLRKRRDGAVVIVEPVQIRNAEMTSLYFVLCGIVAENHAELTHKDAVDDAIRHLTGHFSVVAFNPPNGARIFIQKAKSIAFTQMRDDEFEVFFERALHVIETYLLPGVDIDELRKQSFLRSGYERKPNRRK